MLSSGHVVESRDSMKVFKPESGLRSGKFGIFFSPTKVNSEGSVEDVCFHTFFHIRLKI